MNRERQVVWLLINYAATVAVSAFLLFQVQPLISKFILPWFGGSPAVWTTCLLFFQSVLFAGYAYAHFINHYAIPKWQGLAHLALLAGALLMARIEPSVAWKPLAASDPTWRILMLLGACVGAPYFVLATTGPLLQAWFSRHFPGRSPYRLYALSNLGSLAALLSYPFWFEPRFELGTQTTIWFWGYVVFAGLGAMIAIQVCRTARVESIDDVPLAAAGIELDPTLADPAQDTSIANAAASVNQPPLNWHRLLWLVLPAFSSFVLMAVTHHVCQDVAPIPLLCVVPLSIYLLTFIIAFDHPRWYRRTWCAWGTILSMYAAGVLYDQGLRSIDLFQIGTPGRAEGIVVKGIAWLSGVTDWRELPAWEFHLSFVWAVAVYFIGLFFVCLLCHGELARLRPPARHLTSYYLMISAGGALGGIFVSLIAPLIFVTFFEWNIGTAVGYVLAILLLLGVYLPRLVSPANGSPQRQRAFRVALGLLPLMLAALVGLPDLIGFLRSGGTPLAAARNFYGTVSIRERASKKPKEHAYVLFNGSIVHGIQFADPVKRGEPTTYYGRSSGVGRVLDFYSRQRPATRVGAVGLGAGTLATYARPGGLFRFYEINPAVIAFARDTRYFTFLSQSAGQPEIVQGDARLSLDLEPPQRYDVLVLDAFSGDAIPTHLLTQEAFKIYARHLANRARDGVDGAIAIHITNRYLDLRPVVMAGAEQLGLKWVLIRSPSDDDTQTYRANWMVLSRNEKLLADLAPYCSQEPAPRAPIVWTDSHSDLFGILVP